MTRPDRAEGALSLLSAVQPVPGINSTYFSVQGPERYAMSPITLATGSQSYYRFNVTLAAGYYGAVNVTLKPVRSLSCSQSHPPHDWHSRASMPL